MKYQSNLMTKINEDIDIQFVCNDTNGAFGFIWDHLQPHPISKGPSIIGKLEIYFDNEFVIDVNVPHWIAIIEIIDKYLTEDTFRVFENKLKTNTAFKEPGTIHLNSLSKNNQNIKFLVRDYGQVDDD